MGCAGEPFVFIKLVEGRAVDIRATQSFHRPCSLARLLSVLPLPGKGINHRLNYVYGLC